MQCKMDNNNVIANKHIHIQRSKLDQYKSRFFIYLANFHNTKTQVRSF